MKNVRDLLYGKPQLFGGFNDILRFHVHFSFSPLDLERAANVTAVDEDIKRILRIFT
jgi:hypothetical protein